MRAYSWKICDLYLRDVSIENTTTIFFWVCLEFSIIYTHNIMSLNFFFLEPVYYGTVTSVLNRSYCFCCNNSSTHWYSLSHIWDKKYSLSVDTKKFSNRRTLRQAHKNNKWLIALQWVLPYIILVDQVRATLLELMGKRQCSLTGMFLRHQLVVLPVNLLPFLLLVMKPSQEMRLSLATSGLIKIPLFIHISFKFKSKF